jgi:hypothetical protein
VQKYPVRATVRSHLSTEGLLAACVRHFGTASPDGSGATATFGALAALKVWPEGKDVAVEVRMDPSVEPALQEETIRKYNRFLEEVTGYTSKERASRLRKAAAKGSGGA